MIVFVFPYKNNDSFYIAPDTVICKEQDYYYPDEVRTVRVVPFVYAKISRAGKCVAAKFASRHYNSIGYGIHIKPGLMTRAVPREEVEALCKYCDNNLYLGALSERSEFSYDITGTPTIADLDKAVETTSEYVSLRVGDIIAIESEPIETVDVVNEKQIIRYKDININIR